MCLSRVYVEEKKEENCVIEEVAQIEVQGDNVQISTLFGESKLFQGYSFSSMDSSENYVILKKKQVAHTHEHTHDNNSVVEKLKTLLPHLLTHNQNHAKDIEKWEKKIEEAGYKEAANELKITCDLFNKINNHFKNALKYLVK